MGVNFQMVKKFTCDDDSGTFLIKLQVRFTYYPTFNWVVVGGTDDYEDLKGNGDGYGLFPLFPPSNGVQWPPPIGVQDFYEGKLH